MNCGARSFASSACLLWSQRRCFASCNIHPQIDAEELRRTSEEFSLVLRDMGMLQERIKLLQEEIAAQVNESNNRSLFILTIVTVLALPINIVAGLFGMNVGGVPLAQHEHGFWIVLTVVFTFTALAGWLVIRRQRQRGG